MLLKCKYLAQFSLSELTKNSKTSLIAQSNCPFMSYAKRMLHSESTCFNKLSIKEDIKVNKENIQPPLNNTSEKDKVKNENQLFKYEKYFIMVLVQVVQEILAAVLHYIIN